MQGQGRLRASYRRRACKKGLASVGFSLQSIVNPARLACFWQAAPWAQLESARGGRQPPGARGSSQELARSRWDQGYLGVSTAMQPSFQETRHLKLDTLAAADLREALPPRDHSDQPTSSSVVGSDWAGGLP